MKPLVRWTIGGRVKDEGFLCLEKSIYFWKKIYGCYFDYIVCGNNSNILKKICKIKDVTFIDQNDFLPSLPFCPKDTFWKFCPPRLRLSNHEIIIDNDLLIYKESPTIKWFLSQTKNTITTAAHVAMHGCFSSILKKNKIKVNTGLVGFPPNFDFAKHLKRLFLIYPFNPRGHCDDQGAFLMVVKNNLKIIPMEEIYVCNPKKHFAKYKKGTCGVHFAGLNKGNAVYWNNFLKNS